MLWLIKKSLYPFLLVLLALYSPLPCIAASQMYSISEQELTEIETQLNELENNNEKLEKLLATSDEDLTIALIALKNSQDIQKELKAELLKAKLETTKAEKSLQIAESELQNYRQYATKLEKTQQKNHEIKIGAAYIYNDIYGSISYRNRALTYSILYAKSEKAGFEIEYTLFAW